MGFPHLRVPKDAFGNGCLQFHRQDTEDSKVGPSQPYDLSVDPSKFDKSADKDQQNKDPASRIGPGSLPPAHNSLTYSKIVNMGAIALSDAHEYEACGDAFEEACSYFAQSEVAPGVIYLLGHWNEGHLGCQEGMDVPFVFEKLKNMPGYNAAGHVHCYRVMGTDASPEKLPVGYMLGGTGVRGGNCNTFGVAYVDTTLYPGRNQRI